MGAEGVVEMSERKRDAVIAAAHLVAALLLLSPGYLNPDSAAVYSYLRSLVFDGDLLFFNEWGGLGLIRNGVTLFKEITPVGALANHWWIGTSILSAPAYLVAHLFAVTGSDANGFSGIYAFVLAWSSVAFGAIVCMIAARMMNGAAAWPMIFALAVTVAGTPLVVYQLRYPLGTHLAGALCVAMIVWYLRRLSEDGRWEIALLAGLWCGLAVATRLQHLLLGPAVLFFLIAAKRARSIPLVIAGAILPVATQAIAWYAIYGHPLGPLASGASHAGTTWMPLTRNALLTVLFSSYHGLLSWSPVLILAIAGWIVELRGERRWLAWTFVLMFAGEWIANGLLDRYFWGGLSFGGRRFVDLALPFALGVFWCARRWPRPSLIFGVVATAWNLALVAAAMSKSLDLSRDLLPRDLFASVAAIDFARLSAAVANGPIFRSDGAMLSLGAIVITAGVYVAISRAIRDARIAVFILSLYLAFVCGVLISVIGRNRVSAAEWRRIVRIDEKRSAAMGPLLDEKFLLTQELAFLRNRRRDAEAQQTLRDLAAVDAALQRLGEGRQPAKTK